MKTVCLDFDGVLAHYTEWNGTIGEPNPEGVKLLKKLHEAGYKIVLQSCRWHRDWEEADKRRTEVGAWLVQNGLAQYIHDIEPGSKALADVYVDDRAVHFPLNQGPADEVYKKILSRITQDSGCLN